MGSTELLPSDRPQDGLASGAAFLWGQPSISDGFVSTILNRMANVESNYSNVGDPFLVHKRKPEENTETLHDTSSSSYASCQSCDECAKPVCRCINCDELLCNRCVGVHIQTVKKNHSFVHFVSYRSDSSSNSSVASSPLNYMNSSLSCKSHISEVIKLFCDTCAKPACDKCIASEHKDHNFVNVEEAMSNARNAIKKAIQENKIQSHATQEYLAITEKMMEAVNQRAQIVSSEIKNTIRKFQVILQEREIFLMSKLERIHYFKTKALVKQVTELRAMLSSYSNTCKLLMEALNSNEPAQVWLVKDQADAQFNKAKQIRDCLPTLDDSFSFFPPDSALLLSLSNLGDIKSVDSNSEIPSSEEFMKSIYLKSILNNKSYMDDVSTIENSFITNMNYGTLFDDIPKKSFDIDQLMKNKSVSNKAMEGSGSVRPCGQLGNSRNREPQFVIGGEGDEDGKLCRPWGVCCDSTGNIIVADRSNNRVQIFRPDGTFLHKFGSHGTAPGFFNRPAGITTDIWNRIVIADKDNHRIQVFSFSGKFLLTFGEKGIRPCQFNYPWDVATDSRGRILVSDTRNHRLQMFDCRGEFLAMFGFDHPQIVTKHCDSPRGVTFSPKGCILVTDFNNHRIVILDSELRTSRYFGSGRTGGRQFLRPQGIAVDSFGNMIVADSRNNRIQVFDSNGDFVYDFGTGGTGPGQFDRPSGVAFTPDGKIVVVDFGNNRVQVF